MEALGARRDRYVIVSGPKEALGRREGELRPLWILHAVTDFK